MGRGALTWGDGAARGTGPGCPAALPGGPPPCFPGCAAPSSSINGDNNSTSDATTARINMVVVLAQFRRCTNTVPGIGFIFASLIGCSIRHARAPVRGEVANPSIVKTALLPLLLRDGGHCSLVTHVAIDVVVPIALQNFADGHGPTANFPVIVDWLIRTVAAAPVARTPMNLLLAATQRTSTRLVFA
jgi:hypothetical protein